MDSERSDVYLERVLSFGKAGPGIRVSPSSSTRTLYVLEGYPAHALKVHFPFQVSRYRRRMRDEVVEQAIQVSRWLQDGIASMDGRFAFFREVMGITLRNQEPEAPRTENWGYLIRELRPFPHAQTEGSLVPGFALYGRDYFDPTRPLLLFEVSAERDPAEFILNEVFLPVIRQWVACFLNFGLILEPHGQNVLLELDSSGGVRRIVHRDLNVGIDNRRLRELGLPTESHNSYNRMESGEFASIAYDKFMGGHFFDSVVGLLVERDPSLDPRNLIEPCREAFAEAFPDHEGYLPRTIQYFGEDRDRFGKPLFRDTGEKPRWRP
jgi:siderophore synthetase component